MIASKKYVDETLRQNNLMANKALGQNFLVDFQIANEIVEKANIKEESLVIEIGPGLGALTEILVTKAKKLIAIEIDKNMVNILENTFSDYKNLEIINKDFTKIDIEKLIDENKKEFENIYLISNLPYYITSKILNKILANNFPINTIVVMMQKEVGLKLLNPSLKEISPLSYILKYKYDGQIIKYVSKNSYLPRPNIDSIVLKFDLKKIDEIFFNKFVKVLEILFKNRRKTINNNLEELFGNKEKTNAFLEKIGISYNLHVEQLTLEDILNICSNL